MAIGSDVNPVMSNWDETNDSLRVATVQMTSWTINGWRADDSGPRSSAVGVGGSPDESRR